MLKRQTKFSHIAAFLFVASFVVSVRAQDDTAIIAAPMIEITVIDTIKTDAIAVTDTVETDTGVTTQQPVTRPRTREDLGTMSREELFRLAFGRDAPERPRSMLMRLFVENRNYGDIEILYDADFTSFKFASPRFAQYLDTLLLPETRPLAGDTIRGNFSSAALLEAGYTLDINERQFEAHIAVPPEHKALQRTNLMGGYERVPRGEEILRPFLSFYMNYRLTNRYTYIDYLEHIPDRNIFRGNAGGTRDRAVAALDGAAASFGWTLEGSAVVREKHRNRHLPQETFRRGDVRLVRDFVPYDSRLYIGDVSLGTELLGGDAVGGARYERNIWMFGNDPRGADNKVTFFMPRQGDAELYINGRYADRFFLPAGHHEISGFGGEVGRNNVQIVLRMEDGSVENVPHEFVQSDPRNMPKGEARYSAAAGFLRDHSFTPATYKYYLNEPAASADFMYGLHHLVSGGLAAAASRHSATAGAQALYSVTETRFINARMFLGGGSGGAGAGYRADVSYSGNPNQTITTIGRLINPALMYEAMPRMSFSVRGYYQNAAYSAIDLWGGGLAGRGRAGVSGDLGTSLHTGAISLTAGVDFDSDTLKSGGYSVSGYEYGARINQSIYSVSLSASAGNRVSHGRSNLYFSVNSNYAIGVRVKRHSFSASTNLSTNTRHIPAEEAPERYEYDWRWGANAGWRWANSASGRGAQSYSANVNIPDMLSAFEPAYSVSSRQTLNRAQLTADYGFTNRAADDYDLRTHRVNAVMAGSFMFADGLWAFGRPVSNGFILVSPRHSLKGSSVYVDRTRRGTDLSRNGWLGAAYKNTVTAYSPTQVTLSLSGAPLGAMLPNNMYHVRGAYKQGFALRIGERHSVMLLVRFMNNGNPVSYIYATIEQESGGGDFTRRATFTGADGMLQATGLIRGDTYRIKFGQASGLSDVLITIPRDAELILEMDDIEVKSRLDGESAEVSGDGDNTEGWDDGEDDGDDE